MVREPFPAAQLSQLDHHADGIDHAPGPLQEACGCDERSPRRKEVIDQHQARSGLEEVGMYFELGRAVLQLVALRQHGARELARLTHGGHPASGAGSDSCGEEKPAGLHPRDRRCPRRDEK